jgi:hypothetical protein
VHFFLDQVHCDKQKGYEIRGYNKVNPLTLAPACAPQVLRYSVAEVAATRSPLVAVTTLITLPNLEAESATLRSTLALRATGCLSSWRRCTRL